MHNEGFYGNYYASTSAPIVHSKSNTTFRASTSQIRPQRSVEVHSDGTSNFEYLQHGQIEPNRRLISQFSSDLQPVYLPPTCEPQRSTYRAPLLKANGRSLSARDSEEDFDVEKMNGRTSVCTKRQLPAVPTPHQYASNRTARLSFDAGIGVDILGRQIQNQLVINDTRLQTSPVDPPYCVEKTESVRYTKRSQSPIINDQRARSPNNLTGLKSPKRIADPIQKQLLQGCSRRLNFQRSHQKSFMGNEVSTKTSNPSFSNSFDSSTVHCRSNITLANTRADSTASDDAAYEMHLNKVNTPHASSTGCLQVDQSIHPSKQKRSMNDLYLSTKPTRSSNTLTANVKGNKATKTVKKSSHISNSAQSIINFCVDNAKGDISTRVINRMVSKREDFQHFIGNLTPKQYAEFTNSLREYFTAVVQNLQSIEKIKELSLQFGEEQVSRRTWGFKADYFAMLANALTTECVFLDAASHSPTEAIEAWSELMEIMFANIRDGYYQRIRYLRKNTHCFNSMFSQSSDLSNEETPINTRKPTPEPHMN